MPIKIQSDLPARSVLENENIFVMTEQRAVTQDIRPLKIAIVNLMPTKIATETQLLRLLGNTPLQIEVSLVSMESHTAKNTGEEHLEKFYITSDEALHGKFDGMIITGAPVEQIPFEQVDYWKELCAIMDYAKNNAFCTLYICWGAQAGLYYHYGVPKYPLGEKKFGIFDYKRVTKNDPLLRGFDDMFPCPQSRHTTVCKEDIQKIPALTILAESVQENEEGGAAKTRFAGLSPGGRLSPSVDVLLVKSNSGREIFMTGHLEYDTATLSDEYWRDKNKGLPVAAPRRYFPHDDPALAPLSVWRSTAHLFYSNWLNYYVYQETPYEFA
ncbi:MAG: homoserine O-succinyltransferase [Treponemataceae bacterium]|nr:MAG: homoserine O-succinyltransferase [Treponemataceae bacterium]